MANLARHIPEQRKKSVLRIPESHDIYLCPNSCGRRQGIRALRNGVASHASFLSFSQADVALGDYVGQVEEAVDTVLERVRPRPRVLTLHVNCIDDFLGTDVDALLAVLSARHGDVRFLLSRINPIAGDDKDAASSPARRAQASLYAPLLSRGVRDGGVNVVGSFVPESSDGELARAVRAVGAGPLRQLPGCETFDEYACMADSCLTVSMSHLGDAVAADLEDRLGIPWISWHACYDIEEIARRHELLARLLGAASIKDGVHDACSTSAERARASVARARSAVGGLPVAVDTSATFVPYSLALSLLDEGFNVQAVFALHTKGKDDAEGELRMRYPHVRIFADQDCRSGVGFGVPQDCIAIGRDAAYLLRAHRMVDVYHDEGHFGFEGVERLMNALCAACDAGRRDATASSRMERAN